MRPHSDNRKTGSLSQRVTLHYHESTAAAGQLGDRAFYERSAAGLLRRLGPWLPEDRDTVCLDVACGNGDLVFALERAGFRNVSGVDLSRQGLEQGRQFVKGELVEADVIEHLRTRASGSVGMITAFNFAEHLVKDRALLFFEEAARVLRRGGHLVLMVPNAISPFGASTRYWDVTHEWAFTPNNFRQIAAVSGFSTDVELRECGPVPYGVVSAVRYAAWQVLRASIAAWFLVEVGNTRGGIYSMDMMARLRRSP